jgi:branched-chain amino acid transport system permease protein
MRLVQLLVAALALAGAVALLDLSTYATSLLMFAAVNVLLCLGFYVIFGLSGILSLAHAAFMAIGAYASGIASTRYGWPFPAAVLLAVLVAAGTGALLGIPTLRLKSHYLVLVTIAFSEVVRQLLINLDWLTGGVQGLNIVWDSRIDLFGVKIDFANPRIYLLLCLVAIACAIAVLNRLRESRIGRSLEAIRDDELAARVVGVDVTYYKILAFVVSAALAGFAGSLYAYFVGFVSPDHFTFDTTILVLAMVVIGGKRSIIGVVVGALLLTALPEVLRGLKDWYPTFYGVLLLLVLWAAPSGIVGRIRELRAARQHRPRLEAKPQGGSSE